MKLQKPNEHILLFDGECNLCNRLVIFVIKRDPAKFHFASLQSRVGQQLLQQYHHSTTDLDSFVYIQGNRCDTKSTAALRLFRELGGVWRLLYGLIIIPIPMRDFFYTWIAKNRYRWFGKRETCMIPTSELRERFLE